MAARRVNESSGPGSAPSKRLGRRQYAGRPAIWMTALLIAGPLLGASKESVSTGTIDDAIRAAESRKGDRSPGGSPGSLYTSGGRFSDVARDVRASQIDDTITVVVFDRASAVTRGSVDAQRRSSVRNSATALLGPVAPTSRLANLANLSGEQNLQGQGATSRENSLTTTISGRVVYVFPNGDMVLEGSKRVTVNAEHQLVKIRGIVRPFDITPSNTVRSDRLANLEISVQGKGVVADSVRRPFILYRLLLGLLPF
jgi:flagellar L-ring protein FlgH